MKLVIALIIPAIVHVVSCNEEVNSVTYELLDARIHDRLTTMYPDEGEDLIDDITSFIKVLKISTQLVEQRKENISDVVKMFIDRKGLECLKTEIDAEGLKTCFNWNNTDVNMCFHLLTELKIVWSILELHYNQTLF